MRPARSRQSPLPRRARLRPSRIAAFVNSGFGLWLLSAIFIYGAGASYALWHQRSEKRAASRAAVERLDTEISYRLAKIYEFFRLAETRDIEARLYEAMRDPEWLNTTSEAIEPITRQILKISAKELFQAPDLSTEVAAAQKRLQDTAAAQPIDGDRLVHSSPNQNYEPLYPEYKAYNLAALIALLRDHVPPEERPDLDRSLLALTQFRSVPGQWEMTAAEVSRSIILPRWRGRRFGLLDECPGDPLCIGSSVAVRGALRLPNAHILDGRGNPEFWIGRRPYVMMRMLEFADVARSREGQQRSSRRVK